MSEAWKHLDLEGEGLQSANLRLVRLMKKRSRAYALLALFPLLIFMLSLVALVPDLDLVGSLLGALQNEVGWCEALPPWTQGIRAFWTNLAARVASAT